MSKKARKWESAKVKSAKVKSTKVRPKEIETGLHLISSANRLKALKGSGRNGIKKDGCAAPSFPGLGQIIDNNDSTIKISATSRSPGDLSGSSGKIAIVVIKRS